MLHTGQPKKLVIVSNAGQVDLYDKTDLIPFDKLTAFYQKSLIFLKVPELIRLNILIDKSTDSNNI
jgi:hypothetical protein